LHLPELTVCDWEAADSLIEDFFFPVPTKKVLFKCVGNLVLLREFVESVTTRTAPLLLE